MLNMITIVDFLFDSIRFMFCKDLACRRLIISDKAPKVVCRGCDASALLGKDWQGHYFKNNMLFVPEWRRGFTPGEIRSMFYRCQLISALESEIRLLKKQLEESNVEIERLEIRSDFYRRQVILESRFGMMLQRSFS